MRDVVITSRRIPKTLHCMNCGKKAGWASIKKNHIHTTISTRKYGEFDPQFGCVVKDYSHKKELLRQHDMHELPPETMEEARESPMRGEDRQTERDPKVMVADSLEEIEAQIPKDQIDSRATGDRQRERDNLPFWGEL